MKVGVHVHPPHVVSHWPITVLGSCDLDLFDGNPGWLLCHLCSHGSLTNRFAQRHQHDGAKQTGKPKELRLFTKAVSKQFAVNPSSSLQREKRHFVNLTALNAVDSEACSGLCDHSIFCQRGNKLTKLQIRLSSKMTSRHNKVVTPGAA